MAAQKEIQKPIILIVQGSFQTPDFYAPLETYLQSKGYETHHPILPSCSRIHAPDFASKDLKSDADVVEAALNELIEQEERDVYVVMHSYGGLVGNEAIPESLTRKSREKEGKVGGVIHLFYFASFILYIGDSVLGTFGESPNNELHGDGTYSLKNGATTLFADFSPDIAQELEAQLIPQSHKVEETKLTRSAYEYVPSTYLICENDRACPKEFQEMFATRTGAKVLRAKVGHMPHLSWTEGLGDKILEDLENVITKQ
jgi:predicted alpha/beta hydrolase family esterase